MPSYMCGAITIKLSAANLEDSTTRSLINQHGKEQVSHYQSIEDELKKGSRERPLAEIPLFTEERHPSRLQFLGTHQDMPFLMVKAGRSLNASRVSNRECIGPLNRSVSEHVENDATLLPTATNKSSFADSIMADDLSSDDQTSMLSAMGEDESLDREQESIISDVEASTAHGKKIDLEYHSRLAGHDEAVSKSQKSPQISSLYSDQTTKHRIPSFQDLKPQALCLTVQLSKKSFLPNPYPQIKKLRALDIKIDIYYNGELCTSCYVPERLRSESSIAELTQRFGGRRVDRLLERPWIIVPSGQNADGSLREHRRGKGGGTGALQRWKAVSHILQGEAERGGRNKWGDLSILGDYLKSLSMLEMPKEVEDFQKGGGVRYGIIDVVLTAGHGKKDNPESGYLSGPARMRTSGLRETGLETMLKTPKSLPLPQDDRLRATPTAKQRAKVFADAEIVQSGFSSLAPRRQVSTPSIDTLQQPSDIATTASQVFQRVGVFPAPLAPSTALSAARRRRSGLGQVARASETLASISPVADSSAALQLGNLPRSRPSYRGSGPASNPALRNHTKVRDTNTSRSAWTEFFTKAGDRIISPTNQRGRDYANNLAHETNVKHDRNASQQRRQLSQGCIRPISRAPISTVQDRPKHVAQKRYKGLDCETRGEVQGEQEEKNHKEQTGHTHTMADDLTGTEDINTVRTIEDVQQEKKKKSRMGYINVLTNKLTEAEEIEAIRQVVIDEFAARDGEMAKDTTKPELYTSPLTRRGRPSELQLGPSPIPSASDLAVHHTLPGSALTPGQPLKRTRSQSHGTLGVRTPLILSLSPNLLSTLGTRSQTPAPSYTSPPNSASLSPLSSLVALSPELPEELPDFSHRRVPNAAPKPSRKPSLPATVSASSSAAQWLPSTLNDDCVVTYAPDKLRQVKAERTGWFKEASLLCGVRFLVV
ncbi:hypothetical protein MMC17_002249 [Xylographa soralifera]|nr:hypothetical protein [Xylographa soralifera]